MKILLKLIVTKTGIVNNFLENFSLPVCITYSVMAHVTLLVNRKSLGQHFIECNCNSQPLLNQFNNNFQMYLMDYYISN